MILVLGGTTEGRAAARVIDEAGKPFYYSTRGGEQEISFHNGIRVSGGLDTESMPAFCRDHQIRLLVDASHPFAEALHTTVTGTSCRLHIPAVRFDRIYPEHLPEEIIWHNDFASALRALEDRGIRRLLALTGVQSIRKLRPYWEQEGHDCFIRILDRESSQLLVRQEKFPIERLVYYHAGEDECAVLRQIRPEAVLLKEDGFTGGFDKKVEAALREGVKVYAIRRPRIQGEYSRYVNGENGLRRAVERFVPEYFGQRSGLTTGSCAAAAAGVAAAILLGKDTILLSNGSESKGTEDEKIKDKSIIIEDALSGNHNEVPAMLIGNGQEITTTSLLLPNGETIYDVPLSKIEISTTANGQTESVTVTIIKDGGDDPDATNGLPVVVTVQMTGASFVENITSGLKTTALGSEETTSGSKDTVSRSKESSSGSKEAGTPLTDTGNTLPFSLLIRGGRGIGIVTLPGLGLETGEAAINAVPRKMITDNIRRMTTGLPASQTYDKVHALIVTIAVPGGEEIAARTFNPRLGIEGGISIIGTSGIVKPFSSEAFISSIRKSMEVAHASGSERIVLNSGAKSERFVRSRYPGLPVQAFVHYGNFIGEAIRIAASLNIKKVTLGLMIGKAVKLAEGNLDTHSKKVVMNMEFIKEVAARSGCGASTLRAIGNIRLARELWTLLPPEELERFCMHLIGLCHSCCSPLLPDGELEVMLVGEDGRIIK